MNITHSYYVKPLDDAHAQALYFNAKGAITQAGGEISVSYGWGSAQPVLFVTLPESMDPSSVFPNCTIEQIGVPNVTQEAATPEPTTEAPNIGEQQ